MIQLIIEGETGAEVVQKMRDFLGSLTPANDSQAVAAPAPRSRKPKAGDAPKEDAAAPADPPATSSESKKPEPAAESASSSGAADEKPQGGTPAAGEPPPQVDRAKLESDVRAVLTPLMAGPKAVKATELVAKYGGRVSKVADDQLQPLLDEAKKLAEAA